VFRLPWCCRGLDRDTVIGLLATIRERQGRVEEAIGLLRTRDGTSLNGRGMRAVRGGCVAGPARRPAERGLQAAAQDLLAAVDACQPPADAAARGEGTSSSGAAPGPSATMGQALDRVAAAEVLRGERAFGCILEYAVRRARAAGRMPGEVPQAVATALTAAGAQEAGPPRRI
jgi:hypothetical protein